MADNEVILDKDVKRIAGVRLVPQLGRPWEVYYEVVFVDGRVQQRPLSACACPDAIAHFEGRYFQSAHRDGLPGTSVLHLKDEDAKSESIDESHGSDDDDRHLDDVPSDDSVWDGIVDSQGRAATSPTVRAAIRAKASAPDETFRTPTKDNGDSGEHGSSSKSSASTTTAEPRSATKSDGSATTDSLLMELAANDGAGDSYRSTKRPVRNAAYRGIALRRYANRRLLHPLDSDYDEDDGFSASKNMAKLKVKDEVVDNGFIKQEIDDDIPDPWGGQRAADPWTPLTQPNASGSKGSVGACVGDSWHLHRPMRSYPALKKAVEKARVDGATLPASESLADSTNGSVVGVQRKRPREQRASTTAKARAIEVVTLSADEDEVPRVPAKRSKKCELEAIVYVLSSDSEDTLDSSKP